MSRVARWLRKVWDRVRGRYYEGPAPPGRLRQAAQAFATMNPGATVEDWIAFTAEHAEESYRTGYMRGVEWRERAREQVDPGTAAPLLAEAEAREQDDWSWVDLAPAEAQLKEMVHSNEQALERLSPEDRLLYMDLMGRNMGGFRVQLLPLEDSKRR